MIDDVVTAAATACLGGLRGGRSRRGCERECRAVGGGASWGERERLAQDENG